MHLPVALLVDGDNLSACHATRLLNLAAGLGRIDYARVYGDVARLLSWQPYPRFALIHAGCGKNATDMLLAIDAMDLAHGGLRHFVIASSDGDFRHLALRLQEKGAHIIGAGAAHASHLFRGSCNQFEGLVAPTDCATAPLRVATAGLTAPPPPGGAPPPTLPPAPKPRSTPRNLTEAERQIVDLLCRHDADGKGMLVTALNAHATRVQFKIGQTPEKTWRNWLTQRADLFITDPRGPSCKVRLHAGHVATSHPKAA